MNTKNLTKAFFHVLKTIFLCLLIIITTISIFEGYIWYRDKDKWKTKTTPLKTYTILELCNEFSIPENNHLCEPGEEVYGPDLFPIIKATFLPVEGTPANFAEVEKKLGKYKIECGDLIIQGDGIRYFKCKYDLRGDKAYPITAYFYENGELWKIMNPTEEY